MPKLTYVVCAGKYDGYSNETGEYERNTKYISDFISNYEEAYREYCINKGYHFN